MGRPAGRKIYAHAKLRRLRRERGMNQVELARALGLSTSYLNQIEHSRRPLTAPVLLRIAEVFGVDPEFFSEAGEERLATDLRAALLDEACGIPVPVPQEEMADVARNAPPTRGASTPTVACSCSPPGSAKDSAPSNWPRSSHCWSTARC